MHAQGVNSGILLYWMNSDTYSKDSCSSICLEKDTSERKTAKKFL